MDDSPLQTQQAVSPAETEEKLPHPPGAAIRDILETLLLTLFIFFVVNTATGRYRVDGQSMFPTLHHGEYLIINKLSYFLDEPQRGDIIVLHFPGDREREYIKRVIGVPGDRVEVTEEAVLLNGVRLEEPYTNGMATYRRNSWTVPEGHYFVMGDNRNFSSDSRDWSYLPRADVVGKAWIVYWPVGEWGRVPHARLEGR